MAIGERRVWEQGITPISSGKRVSQFQRNGATHWQRATQGTALAAYSAITLDYTAVLATTGQFGIRLA